MLFNSYIFIFLFLPLALTGFFVIGQRLHHRVACAWLVAASLVFYGWEHPEFLGVLLISLLGNYGIGSVLASQQTRHKSHWLWLGILANLSSLAYYKYTNFIIANWNLLSGSQFELTHIVLPLGISFFTFQQIAYLVDAYRGETREYNFLHYSLFVCFFPQLVAGPIVHHRQVLPQFAQPTCYRFSRRNLSVGLSLFALGLFKKAVLADGIAPLANHVFSAGNLSQLSPVETALGILAYALQLYFDFSGYSDMAIGLGRMFGIHLPTNFHSPYQSTSIVDFWRRWHITLSHFLRDYLYIPLGGSRNGPARRYLNLLATMVLGGLWHGAGWNFLIWGGLHGLYLCINHLWRAMMGSRWDQSRLWGLCAWLLTFAGVLLSWVFFRATSFNSALDLLARLLPQAQGNNWAINLPDSLNGSVLLLPLMLVIALLLPNSRQWMHKYRPGARLKGDLPLNLNSFYARFRFRFNSLWLGLISLCLFFGILALARVSEFLYFQF